MQCLAHGFSRHRESFGQVALGRHGVSFVECRENVVQFGAYLVMLGKSHIGCHGATTFRAVPRLSGMEPPASLSHTVGSDFGTASSSSNARTG
ncbi:Uncharacterised protein [Mycobacteroides abscessus subsp. abscessus]|nr:Uncharacterised protein [Mycobacteroides abscessus subsp. abscessus]